MKSNVELKLAPNPVKPEYWRCYPSPDTVEILLCRGSAQKIGTDSAKKLLKNKIKPKKISDQQTK
jgi:hypothetical protein